MGSAYVEQGIFTDRREGYRVCIWKVFIVYYFAVLWSHMKNKNFTILLLVSAILLMAVVVYTGHPNRPPQRPSTRAFFGIVNLTSNKLVYLGAGDICAPAFPNMSVVSDCVEVNQTEYNCSGTDYALNSYELYCGGPGNWSVP
jgi:hypothetical protein